MYPNRFLVNLLSMTLWIGLSGCALTPNYAVKFETKESETNFVVHFAPRVPKAFGGEENVYIQKVTPLGKSRKYQIDHNGRFSRKVWVDSGNGGKWARIYLEWDQPKIGESRPFRTNELGEMSWIFKDFRSGQTSVSNLYPYSVIALVNFESGFVINGYHVNSTVAERNDRLIGSTQALSPIQKLRGDTVIWERTIRSEVAE